MPQSGGNLAIKRKNVGKTEILIKDGKCYKDENIAKRQKILEGRKSYENTKNVAKTEILLKHEKCYKDGNIAKLRKILERRKSYKNTENVERRKSC